MPKSGVGPVHKPPTGRRSASACILFILATKARNGVNNKISVAKKGQYDNDNDDDDNNMQHHYAKIAKVIYVQHNIAKKKTQREKWENSYCKKQDDGS